MGTGELDELADLLNEGCWNLVRALAIAKATGDEQAAALRQVVRDLEQIGGTPTPAEPGHATREVRPGGTRRTPASRRPRSSWSDF